MMQVKKTFWILFFTVFVGTAFGQQSLSIIEPVINSYRSANIESQIVNSERGEIILGWRSARKESSFNNIYLQKVDLEGNLLWEGDGTPVCPFPANQGEFDMVEDGYGGIVVVWEDSRRSKDRPIIVAQRINLRGEALWGRDGIEISQSAGGQRKPKIISDQKNGFYVIWQDSRRGPNEVDLYAQHINLGGKLNWLKDGLPIVTADGIQKNFELVTDENHFLYLVWEDFRNGLYWNLYAQKLDREGNFFWKPNGLDIFAGVEENHTRPHLIPDGFGGIIFVYEKYSLETRGYDIYRGRLNGAGEILYHYSTCHSQDNQQKPKIVKKGSLALIYWEDRRHGQWDIYAQMIRIKDGIFEWGLNGVPVVQHPGDDQLPVAVTSVSYNYQVFAWLRSEGSRKQLFVQKLDNYGGQEWREDGIQVCRDSWVQEYPAILSDDRGGLWCSWTDPRDPNGRYIYLQRVNGYGALVMEKAGKKLAGEHEGPYAEFRSLQALASRNGSFFVAWEDYRNGKGNPDIYLQKLDADGKPMWRRSGIPVICAAGEQTEPILVDDGVGGVILVWVDHRNGSDDNLYAQRINSNGKVLWSQDGIVICDAPRSQGLVKAISDGQEGVILTWSDARTLVSTGFDLYVQRINHGGEAYWGKNGKPFAKFEGLQSSPSMASDGQGGAFITWMDNRLGPANIFLQHINGFGIAQWETGGKRVQPSEKNQRNPQILKAENNRLYLAWEDARYGDGYEKIVMQCTNLEGRILWDARGQLACNYPGRQSKVRLELSDQGSFWACWLDDRSKSLTGTRLFIQKYDEFGNPLLLDSGTDLGSQLVENNRYRITVDLNSYAFVLWNKTVSEQKEIVFQALSPGGEKQYGSEGKRRNTGASQEYPALISNERGKTLAIWVEKDDQNANEVRGIFGKI